MVRDSVCQINSPASSSASVSELEALGQWQVAGVAHTAPARLLGRHVLNLAVLGRRLQVQAPEGLFALVVHHGLVEALAGLDAEQLVARPAPS